jgi:two-component system cell cycle response regulator
LADECRRAKRYSHPLSVIMLDVDGFKSYNDTYGHVQGDVLLKMLAGILQTSVRGVDSIGRFGGEEFIVVMPETPPEEAYQAAERLRLAVAQTIFPGFADDPELVVFKTISLGVATFPSVTHDPQSLVTLADNALYRAKRGGRNQTIQADPETLTLERDPPALD